MNEVEVKEVVSKEDLEAININESVHVKKEDVKSALKDKKSSGKGRHSICEATCYIRRKVFSIFSGVACFSNYFVNKTGTFVKKYIFFISSIFNK